MYKLEWTSTRGFGQQTLHWFFFLDDGVLLKSTSKILSWVHHWTKRNWHIGHFLDYYVKNCEEEPLKRSLRLLCTAGQCLSHRVSLFLPPKVASICDFCTVLITGEYKQPQPFYEKIVIALTSTWRLLWILGSNLASFELKKEKKQNSFGQKPTFFYIALRL